MKKEIKETIIAFTIAIIFGITFFYFAYKENETNLNHINNMKNKIGTIIKFNNNDVLIINYNPENDSYILSNGMEVNSILID